MEEGRKTSDVTQPRCWASLQHHFGHLAALHGGSRDVGAPQSHGAELQAGIASGHLVALYRRSDVDFLLGHRNGLLLGPRGRPETAKVRDSIRHPTVPQRKNLAEAAAL